MAGYVRADVSNDIDDGKVIDADTLDAEFDALLAAFNATTGHDHGGTSANGAPITKVGPAQDVVVSGTSVLPKTTATVDLGSDTLKFKDLHLSGDVDVNGALTIDGLVLGSSFGTPSGIDYGYTFADDPDTKFYRQGVATVRFAINGVDKFQIDATTITAMGTVFTGDGSGITSLDASSVSSGTLSINRFPDATGADERNWVANAIVAKHGVAPAFTGHFAFLKNVTGGEVAAGNLYDGSSLRYSGSDNLSRGSLTGSWRALGSCGDTFSTLFIKV